MVQSKLGSLQSILEVRKLNMFVAKILLVCATVALVAASPQLGGFGAPRELSPEEIAESTKVLRTSLAKLDAGDGPHYTIVKVLSASTQVVSGSKDSYRVELADSNGATKTCNVDIWSQPWIKEDGIQVTFDCPNEPQLVKKHNP